MHGIWKAIGSFVRRADMILLSLCIAASVFGIVVISSATNVKGSAQYVRTQILALVLGIILYVFSRWSTSISLPSGASCC